MCDHWTWRFGDHQRSTIGREARSILSNTQRRRARKWPIRYIFFSGIGMDGTSDVAMSATAFQEPSASLR